MARGPTCSTQASASAAQLRHQQAALTISMDLHTSCLYQPSLLLRLRCCLFRGSSHMSLPSQWPRQQHNTSASGDHVLTSSTFSLIS